MLLGLKEIIKKQKAEEAERNKVKKYTIAELLEGDSSDDESYSGATSKKALFPWYAKGYTNIHDTVSLENNTAFEYPKAVASDNFIALKPISVKEVDPPKRILIVSPTSNGVDHILDLL
jgi:hypothetical protein